MAINVKCPKCGSTHVQLSNEMNKHGCLWTLLFGVYYLAWLCVRFAIGCMVFFFYDWWMKILKTILRKGHVWQCKRWFSNRRKIYYCHNCGHNFRA